VETAAARRGEGGRRRRLASDRRRGEVNTRRSFGTVLYSLPRRIFFCRLGLEQKRAKLQDPGLLDSRLLDQMKKGFERSPLLPPLTIPIPQSFFTSAQEHTRDE
jgi:hypothetical protein